MTDQSNFTTITLVKCQLKNNFSLVKYITFYFFFSIKSCMTYNRLVRQENRPAHVYDQASRKLSSVKILTGSFPQKFLQYGDARLRFSGRCPSNE